MVSEVSPGDMSKRRAATDLNHDNWDREEEPETAGKFIEAPKEVVQERVIRMAKRRLPQTSSSSIPTTGASDEEPKKLFSSFTGFGKVKSSGAESSAVSEIAKNSFSFLKKSDTPLKKLDMPLTNSSDSKSDKVIGNETNEKYLSKLKGLNEAVLDWIKQHVESNPCCILTPVFKDYDNYLKEIQTEKNSSSGVTIKGTKDTVAPFSFGSDSSKFSEPISSEKAPAAPTFSLGNKESTADKSTPLFTFGAAASKAAPPSLIQPLEEKSPLSSTTSDNGEKRSLFTFGSSSAVKPAFDIKNIFPSGPPGGSFTFQGLNKPQGTEEKTGLDNGEENEEEEVKEPQGKAATEDDAIYTKRVKLFVKKGKDYSDLGVGNMFIKKAPNDWHQVIVRTDTSLGNIIFNILLSVQHPTKRLGKNNVMIVCQPTQDYKTAVPVLLRVKTAEEADQLLETLEMYKKK